MQYVKDKVITLLGDGADVNKVSAITDMVEAAIIERLQDYNPQQDVLPVALGWIAVELVIARYNRIGSEGMTSESVDGHAATYNDDAGLDAYDGVLLRWAKRSGYIAGDPDDVKVKFI